ncbi:MAG: hypothetical protein KJ970_13210 [Candidatus Eisenbacteria bacterium]|uniref:Uncharacterized protein n=1 Tax=Eiseniibacteriota bacterium TaxID=2212470 RepID=A0A948RYE3_UNCEI|nr:hypothetical protein [Candidatus Eisenbacteria bacterium]MBU2691873.1 hypothetical protein [Candidatus Eisenbacteria bacterium]
MMKRQVEITRHTRVADEGDVSPGDIILVPEHVALEIQNANKGRILPPLKPVPAEEIPEDDLKGGELSTDPDGDETKDPDGKTTEKTEGVDSDGVFASTEDGEDEDSEDGASPEDTLEDDDEDGDDGDDGDPPDITPTEDPSETAKKDESEQTSGGRRCNFGRSRKNQ